MKLSTSFYVDNQSLEEIASGIHHAILDHQIYFMRIDTTNPASLDAYFEHALRSLDTFNTAQPRLALVEFGQASLISSTELKTRHDVLIEDIRKRGIYGRAAIVTPRSPLVILGKSMINYYFGRTPDMLIKIFFELSDGYKWLVGNDKEEFSSSV